MFIPQSASINGILAYLKPVIEATLNSSQFGIDIEVKKVRFLNSDLLHEYFKARFDVKTTTKMTTADFSTYTDSIQLLMTEQSGGEYQPIYPETTYQTME